MSKRHQAAPAPAKVVTVFRGDQLEPILRNILHQLDAARVFREQGHPTAQHYEKIARYAVHDLLCEVVS